MNRYCRNFIFILSLFLIFSLCGCIFFRLDRELGEISETYALGGMVSAKPSLIKDILVVVYEKTADGSRLYQAVIVNPHNGRYSLDVKKGEYYIGAFADLNHNLTHDKGEPAGYYGKPDAIEISEKTIDATASKLKEIPEIPVSSSKNLPPGYHGEIILSSEMIKKSFIKTGELISFDDKIMAIEYGSKGYWEPMTFLREVGFGIFFLEEYDEDKIPILFLHGAVGTPLAWKESIEQISRDRYQPWFYYYPSGLPLEKISTSLNSLINEMHREYGFKEMVVVAQSMGGLVARSFILKNIYGSKENYIRMFISVSTPWNGHKMSEKGVKQAPTAVPSWHDMVPGSKFISSLYENHFPPYLKHYLFFSYKGDCSLFLENNDGTVELSSQLDYRAQAEAEGIYGYNEDHGSIVFSKEYLAKIAEILGE